MVFKDYRASVVIGNSVYKPEAAMINPAPYVPPPPIFDYDSLAGVLAAWEATQVTVTTGKVDQMDDLTVNGNNLTSTGINRPDYTGTGVLFTDAQNYLLDSPNFLTLAMTEFHTFMVVEVQTVLSNASTFGYLFQVPGITDFAKAFDTYIGEATGSLSGEVLTTVGSSGTFANWASNTNVTVGTKLIYITRQSTNATTILEINQSAGNLFVINNIAGNFSPSANSVNQGTSFRLAPENDLILKEMVCCQTLTPLEKSNLEAYYTSKYTLS